MSESYRRVRALKAKAESATRVLNDRQGATVALGNKKTASALKDLVKPNSPSKTLRKTGAALILAPDPLTGVVGVAMVGASIALRNRDPMSVGSLCAEARRLIDEMGSS